MTLLIEREIAPIGMTQNSIAKTRTGWTLSGLMIAFNLFDAVGKFAMPAPVIEALERTGWSIDLAVPLGVILLLCTIVYAIPRTAVLGAILLTAYLGGAVATNMRLHNPLLTHTLFPVYFGILVWLGVWLREPRLRQLTPFVR